MVVVGNRARARPASVARPSVVPRACKAAQRPREASAGVRRAARIVGPSSLTHNSISLLSELLIVDADERHGLGLVRRGGAARGAELADTEER